MLAIIYLIGLIATPVMAGIWTGWMDDEFSVTNVVMASLLWPLVLIYGLMAVITYAIKTLVGRS